MKNFRKQLARLKKLNLPNQKYAVFGSGLLAMKCIRDINDLDIIVKPELWDNLVKKFPRENDKLIRVGSIEIYKDWLPWFDDVISLIDGAKVFEEVRFVRLKHVLKWKKIYGRGKDKKDVQLIEKFIKKADS
jgi:hypothetical protein